VYTQAAGMDFLAARQTLTERVIRLYEKLGSHPMKAGGEDGSYFAVWAPNAELCA
jgi:1,4-alpha-glucan branching enzyme